MEDLRVVAERPGVHGTRSLLERWYDVGVETCAALRRILTSVVPVRQYAFGTT